MRFFCVNNDNPLNGWHMLAIVGLFFGTIITANLVMAFYAVGSFPGLIVNNSYVASQHYNTLLDEAGKQDRRGWVSDISVHDGIVRVRLADAQARPVRGLSVSAVAGRPASRRDDRTFAFHPIASGYGADTALEAGRWMIELRAHDAGRLVYRRTQELFIPGAGK